RLLIGVKDNGAIAGGRDEDDIVVGEQAAQMYCSPEVELTFTAFRVEGAQTVIRAEIARSEVRPVRVIEADGRVRAYYRVADENIVAHPLMVRMWESEREGVLLRMGDAERRIASLLDNRRERPMSVDEIARGAHISQRTAEDAIVRLAGMGVVGFAYSGGSFGIILTDSDEATADTPR
ncbi:MAG: ATP-binding protein, partial [Paramuribaculum sp.]|nr:ATP-binding protein [Paramuribaculum sp.]